MLYFKPYYSNDLNKILQAMNFITQITMFSGKCFDKLVV